MGRHRKTVERLADTGGTTVTVKELQEKVAQAKAERKQRGGTAGGRLDGDPGGAS